MKIIVCIKQVPDTTKVRINPQTNTLIREGVKSIINPYDMHAIEAGLWLKEKLGGSVTVISMGPLQVEEALREAISIGVDDAVLLTDKVFAGADTLATAFTLSSAIKNIGYDIVICGKQAIDGDTAQVGPEIAEFLDIPHIAYVKKIEKISNKKIIVYRMMEQGYDIVESSLPVLITVVKELNEPRFPSIKGKLKAKKANIKKLSHKDISVQESQVGLKGSPTKVKNIFTPEIKKKRIIFQGSVVEQVEQLVKELKRLNFL